MLEKKRGEERKKDTLSQSSLQRLEVIEKKVASSESEERRREMRSEKGEREVDLADPLVEDLQDGRRRVS